MKRFSCCHERLAGFDRERRGCSRASPTIQTPISGMGDVNNDTAEATPAASRVLTLRKRTFLGAHAKQK
jgi:hypothetical protein